MAAVTSPTLSRRSHRIEPPKNENTRTTMTWKVLGPQSKRTPPLKMTKGGHCPGSAAATRTLRLRPVLQQLQRLAEHLHLS